MSQLLPTDPKRTSFLVEARVKSIRNGFEAHCAQMPTVSFWGSTLKEAVMGMSAKVGDAIRACRTAETPIPWVQPEPIAKDESSYRAQVVMKAYDPNEKFYLDQTVCRHLRTWARLGRKADGKRARKFRRKLAVRLRELGRNAEAAHVLDHGWHEWEDPGCMEWEADDRTGELLGILIESDRMREAVASYREQSPHAVMKAWWLRMATRINTERGIMDPRNQASDEDVARWRAKQAAIPHEIVKQFKGMTPAQRAEYIERENKFLENEQKAQAERHHKRLQDKKLVDEMVSSEISEVVKLQMVEQSKKATP